MNGTARRIEGPLLRLERRWSLEETIRILDLPNEVSRMTLRNPVKKLGRNEESRRYKCPTTHRVLPASPRFPELLDHNDSARQLSTIQIKGLFDSE